MALAVDPNSRVWHWLPPLGPWCESTMWIGFSVPTNDCVGFSLEYFSGVYLPQLNFLHHLLFSFGSYKSDENIDPDPDPVKLRLKYLSLKSPYLASRNLDLRIMTASHVLCLSWTWIALNFLWMMLTILSISLGAIGRVRLCSLRRFITCVVNSLHACWGWTVKNRWGKTTKNISWIK